MATAAVAVCAEAGMTVHTGPVVFGMATRAVGFIGRRAPGDGFAVAAMAVGAPQVLAVVTRVVCGGMTERQRQPVIGAMADIALL